jgi:hypothetical protein
VERLLACRDWGEIVIAVNLLFEPLVASLFAREFLTRFAAHHGDAVTPVLLETADADRRRNMAATVELVRFLLADTPANRGVIEGWLQRWAPRAVRATQAFAPLFACTEERPFTFTEALTRVRDEYAALLSGLGLQTPQEVQS